METQKIEELRKKMFKAPTQNISKQLENRLTR